jgi:hypothetical protein
MGKGKTGRRSDGWYQGLIGCKGFRFVPGTSGLLSANCIIRRDALKLGDRSVEFFDKAVGSC